MGVQRIPVSYKVIDPASVNIQACVGKLDPNIKGYWVLYQPAPGPWVVFGWYRSQRQARTKGVLALVNQIPLQSGVIVFRGNVTNITPWSYIDYGGTRIN